MSKRSDFLRSVATAIFNRGLVPPFATNIDDGLYDRFGTSKHWPSVDDAVDFCIEAFDLTLSPPAYEFLAYHEAGHAIAGMNARVRLRGVRFHEGGASGVAVLQDLEWRHSTNVRLLERLIEVDVAGNVAERVANKLRPNAERPAPLLSEWYYPPLAGSPIPPDFLFADARAHQLDHVLTGGPGKYIHDVAVYPAKRALLEQAEQRVEKLLRDNLDAFRALSVELLKGPMRGNSIRRLVGELR